MRIYWRVMGILALMAIGLDDVFGSRLTGIGEGVSGSAAAKAGQLKMVLTVVGGMLIVVSAGMLAARRKLALPLAAPLVLFLLGGAIVAWQTL